MGPVVPYVLFMTGALACCAIGWVSCWYSHKHACHYRHARHVARPAPTAAAADVADLDAAHFAAIRVKTGPRTVPPIRQAETYAAAIAAIAAAPAVALAVTAQWHQDRADEDRWPDLARPWQDDTGTFTRALELEAGDDAA